MKKYRKCPALEPGIQLIRKGQPIFKNPSQGNLRAMQIKQEPSEQIESTEDLYKSGMRGYVYHPYWYKDYLRSSGVKWHRLIEPTLGTYSKFEEMDRIITSMYETGRGAIMQDIRDFENHSFKTNKTAPLHRSIAEHLWLFYNEKFIFYHLKNVTFFIFY